MTLTRSTPKKGPLIWKPPGGFCRASPAFEGCSTAFCADELRVRVVLKGMDRESQVPYPGVPNSLPFNIMICQNCHIDIRDRTESYPTWYPHQAQHRALAVESECGLDLHVQSNPTPCYRPRTMVHGMDVAINSGS